MPDNWTALRDRLQLTLRPLDAWPVKPTSTRQRSPFSANLTSTLGILKKELSHLGAKSPVLQIAIRERDLRLDGLPRADARPTEPGVILSFESRYGNLRLHQDLFPSWQENLRSIALHLEHLRLASLYGVGKDGEQYRGWAALPESTGGGSSETIIRAMAGCGPEVGIKDAYRLAIRKHHPDSGGTRADWDRLRAAAEGLGL